MRGLKIEHSCMTLNLLAGAQDFGTSGKCSEILNTFLLLFSNKMMAIKAEIHKLLVIWVCTACLSPFGIQLAFKLLEH